MATKGMFAFDVRPDGEAEFRVIATSRDVSLWERTHKGRSLKQIEDNLSISLFEELAVVACRRQGRWGGSLAEFREACDIDVIDISGDGDDDADGDEAGAGLDPTRPGR